MFRKTATGSSSTSLSLQLPIDGASVPFFVLGRFGQPSVSDGDVEGAVNADPEGDVSDYRDAALAVVVGVVDGRNPQMPDAMRSTATLLGVSAGAATI